MKNISLLSVFSFVGAITSLNASAVPNYLSTTLPIETTMFSDSNLKDVLEFLPTLTVYQDSENPNQYYYLPPFRAVDGIAASAITNDAQIARFDKIDNIQNDLYTASNKEWFALQAQYLSIKTRLNSLKPADEFMRPALESLALQIKTDYDAATLRASQATAEVPIGIVNAANKRISQLLAAGGFTMSDSSSLNEQLTLLGRFSRSNGGVFTTNIFAGFYGNEAAVVKKYHEARAIRGLPRVNISLISVESFEWGSLAETVTKSDGSETAGVPLFRSINGGGNLTGSTVNADLTIDGARKFQNALPPIILPIYAKATLIQKYPSFKARLKCDFTTGWTVEGRADVKDGLVIYNNDITTSMVAKDVSSTKKPCSVTFDGGGAPSSAIREAAYRESLLRVQDKLTDLYLTRTNLAQAEKTAYFNGITQDIQNNRHTGANNGWSESIQSYVMGGWTGLAVSTFSQASNFYWHTNIQQVKNLSNLKWEEEITDNSNSNLQISLPMQICLAYNPAKKAYVSCAKDELLNSDNVTRASEKAKASVECQATTTSAECGNARAQSAAVNPVTGNILPQEL